MTAFGSLDEQKIRQIIQPYCAKKNRLLLTIGLVKDGEKAIFHEGAVPGPPEHPSPSPGVLYEIGSITKVFTAALLAKAIREGRVRLDDSIVRFYPPLERNRSLEEHPVTLRHLTTHTSGLPSLPVSFLLELYVSRKKQQNPYLFFTEERMLRFLEKFTFPAKRKFSYSNLGVGLLGSILARVYEGDYESVLQEHICRPLDLKDTAISLTAEQTQRLVPGYGKRNKPVSSWDFRSLEGAGALRSSVHDLLLFVDVNIGGSEHPLEPLLADTHQVLHKDPDGTAVGMNWIVERHSPVLWHNGGTGGYSSFLGFDKERKTGVVVLSNYTSTSMLFNPTSVEAIGFHLLALLGE